ncbi:uncharacterized protein ASPGLDRAFT_987773 [Aspergillus glaucus CBS 516.65]|uniref:Uncharacterized protein n=1 Tax=Aspergillus glaucus CBS 516.65 TaxID=1160497 RepID=A0A1L9VUY5_ASPGL|nr:hypothetical protein ASPGLDRAFT_987773 [Aspergillus glaucus CBS 516.65]OJJ87725.1 hypothetical protein ASPGLDRAFT_987773 [Aspergillus glaucus CBS 516.65]
MNLTTESGLQGWFIHFLSRSSLFRPYTAVLFFCFVLSLYYLSLLSCKRQHRGRRLTWTHTYLHSVESGYPVFFDILFSFVVYLQGCFRFGDLAGGLYLSVYIELPYRPDS